MDEENAPQGQPERVIRTSEDLATALTEKFLANAAAGDHAANDELISELREWKRGRQS